MQILTEMLEKARVYAADHDMGNEEAILARTLRGLAHVGHIDLNAVEAHHDAKQAALAATTDPVDRNILENSAASSPDLPEPMRGHRAELLAATEPAPESFDGAVPITEAVSEPTALDPSIERPAEPFPNIEATDIPPKGRKPKY